MVVDKTFAAARLETIVGNVGASAVAGFGNGQNFLFGVKHAKTGNAVAFAQRNRFHAAGGSADAARVLFVKGDAHTLFGRDHQPPVAVGQLHPAKLVTLIEIDGGNAALADIFISVKLGALNDAVSRHHAKIIRLFGAEVRHAHHRRDFFVRGKRENVDDVHAFARTAALGDFIAFQAVNAAE